MNEPIQLKEIFKLKPAFICFKIDIMLHHDLLEQLDKYKHYQIFKDNLLVYCKNMHSLEILWVLQRFTSFFNTNNTIVFFKRLMSRKSIRNSLGFTW